MCIYRIYEINYLLQTTILLRGNTFAEGIYTRVIISYISILHVRITCPGALCKLGATTQLVDGIEGCYKATMSMDPERAVMGMSGQARNSIKK